jgi:hypothetical protein
MSFGGSVAGMITSLKANKRSKGDNLFKREKSYYKEKINIEKLLKKKSTPEQLKSIRQKLIKENKRNQIKNLKILIIVSIVIILTYIVSEKLIL